MIPELRPWDGADSHLAHHKAHIWHQCYAVLLKPIKEAQQNGVSLFNVTAGKQETFTPLLAQFQSDIPEKHLATLTQPGSERPCWKCLVMKEELLFVKVSAFEKWT